jgi:hypothetical protein
VNPLALAGEIGSILAAAAAITGIGIGIRNDIRKKADKERTERAEIAGQNFALGATSRENEVALLRSQRDDAREARDSALATVREQIKQISDLEAELRRRP